MGGFCEAISIQMKNNPSFTYKDRLKEILLALVQRDNLLLKDQRRNVGVASKHIFRLFNNQSKHKKGETDE